MQVCCKSFQSTAKSDASVLTEMVMVVKASDLTHGKKKNTKHSFDSQQPLDHFRKKKNTPRSLRCESISRHCCQPQMTEDLYHGIFHCLRPDWWEQDSRSGTQMQNWRRSIQNSQDNETGG